MFLTSYLFPYTTKAVISQNAGSPQEERQHRHDEDAKAEAGSALHKTGPDAQQEYGYHNTTHRYSVKKKSISLPLLAAGLE